MKNFFKTLMLRTLFAAVMISGSYLAICNIDARLEEHYLAKNNITLNKVAVPAQIAMNVDVE